MKLSFVILLATAVIGIQGKSTEIPKKYDGSFTLRVDYTRRYYDGYWRWGDYNAPHELTSSSKVIKRDAENERFQQVEGDVVVVQRREQDGEFKTYTINEAAGTCKVEKDDILKTGSLKFPSSASREEGRTTKFGRVEITFYESFGAQSSVYVDEWHTVWNTATNSYLPASHIGIFADNDLGTEYAVVKKTTYSSVEHDWVDVPNNCF